MTIKKLIAIIFPLVLISSCGVSPERTPSAPEKSSSVYAPEPVHLFIKKRISGWKSPSKAVVAGEQIYAAFLVEKFYGGRNFEPAWSKDGRLIQADMLIRAVEEAYYDGLTPDYYHLGAIRNVVNGKGKDTVADPLQLAEIDLLLTDTFLTLGCHLSAGCANPSTVEPEWFAKHGSVDVASVLDRAIERKKIREALLELRPEQGQYGRLKQTLARYRGLSLKGDWPLVSTGPLLKKGSVSARVLEVRKRLAASSDPEAGEVGTGEFFDEQLQKAVMVFQRRHGVKDDGIVGPATLNALNVPLKQRVRQIELSMERLRWILGNREERSIVINIANYELGVIENGSPILSMKVVVGKPLWSTPVFTAKMAYILINPYWNVPDTIARKELLKTVKDKPRYLAEQNIKLLKGWGARETEVDPETVNWARINEENLPFRFRQEPGPLNPLGRIKFVFPNKFDVYLHDTPARGLFSQDVRAYSHGCIRIEKPIELAEYLLQGDPSWTRERLLSEMEKGIEQKVEIRHKLNVHFLYLTAWVDEEGILHFRDDIYGRDKRLDEALRKKT